MKFIQVIKGIHQIIEWTQLRLNKKQFILLSSVLVGLSVGLAAIVLKTFVHYIFVVATYNHFGHNKHIFIALPILGIFLTVLLVKRIFKGKLEKVFLKFIIQLQKNQVLCPKNKCMLKF